jgi:2-polyprenyl-6-hydroxyphenyl methylase/3-demethylubiquinone-9 3-methyltransferase
MTNEVNFAEESLNFGCSLDTEEDVQAWFNSRGGTDNAYLKAHFQRFKASYDFAAVSLLPASRVLDVGAHWLHQAIFFSGAGHQLVCAEVAGGPPDLLTVQKQAQAMGAELVLIKRLELGQGIDEVADDSIDAIMFSEILEHLAFNPIPMWKVFYQKIRNLGKIYISTPNSCYFRSVYRQLKAMNEIGGFGVSIDEVLESGTYGHHWKEYSIPEIRHYFSSLSSDFSITRIVATSYGNHEDEIYNFESLASESCISHVDFHSIISDMDAHGMQPFGKQLFIELTVVKTKDGITLDPPWIPV